MITDQDLEIIVDPRPPLILIPLLGGWSRGRGVNYRLRCCRLGRLCSRWFGRSRNRRRARSRRPASIGWRRRSLNRSIGNAAGCRFLRSNGGNLTRRRRSGRRASWQRSLRRSGYQSASRQLHCRRERLCRGRELGGWDDHRVERDRSGDEIRSNKKRDPRQAVHDAAREYEYGEAAPKHLPPARKRRKPLANPLEHEMRTRRRRWMPVSWQRNYSRRGGNVKEDECRALQVSAIAV